MGTDIVLCSKTVLLKISSRSFSVILYCLVKLIFISICSLSTFTLLSTSVGEASTSSSLPFQKYYFSYSLKIWSSLLHFRCALIFSKQRSCKSRCQLTPPPSHTKKKSHTFGAEN